MAVAKEPRMSLAQNPDISSQISYEIAPESENNGGFSKNTGFLFCSSNYQPDVSRSVINFKNQIDQNLIHLSTESSLLSFGQSQQVVGRDDYFSWPAEGESFGNGCQWSQMISSPSSRLLEDFNCFQKASNFTPMEDHSKEKQRGSDGSGKYWLYSEESDVFVEEESRTAHEQTSHKKRLHSMDSEQSTKKQCNNSPKKTSPKTSPAKDPQSMAAKNRRERISDRLKTLQELVPNGSKVDLVTMLEKAISYVRFLQLQVKILGTDEFWPVQGGKAPDISQVREAIDAILSSERERSSSSNSAMLINGG